MDLNTEIIKIGPLSFDLVFVEDLRSDDKKTELYGHIKYGPNQILIETDCCEQRKLQVILHEIIHGIFDQYSIEQDEALTERLSHALLELIVDNPVLLIDIQNWF